MITIRKQLLPIHIIFCILMNESEGWWLWDDDSAANDVNVGDLSDNIGDNIDVINTVIDDVMGDVNIKNADDIFDKGLENSADKEHNISKNEPEINKEVDKNLEMKVPLSEQIKGNPKDGEFEGVKLFKDDALDSENSKLSEVDELTEEVINDHSVEGHYHDGEHNDEYDQKMFLGEETLSEFKHLSAEESKARLEHILIDKVDQNGDKLVTVEELTKWIKHTGEKSVKRRTELFWKRSNPEGRVELSWDEYRARQYGFLTDRMDSTSSRRWVGEDDVDKSTLNIYLNLEERDRRRWTVADRNKNLRLDQEEFLGFLHPEVVPYMADILVTETMADLDKDLDGKLNLTEYVLNMYGDTKNVDEWNRAGIEFRRFRDKNGDGFIDKQELKAWIQPESYDQHQAEAEHLIHGSDQNSDKKLSIDEALDRYSMFVSSQATNFGEDLKISHDEL